MSKIIASAAIRGSNKIALQAEQFVEKARTEKSEDVKIGFPDTAYFLPMAYALMGLEIKTLGDLKPVLAHIRELLSQEPAGKLWFPYLGSTLDAGIATLLSEEIIAVLRYLYNEEPQPGCNGFFTDTI
ncbi:MAG: CO dehydrogenase/CO-methylating acetyl-CoA synthase complex subunit beta, partial [Thermodesulfobacteriota bacterium]